MQKKENTKTYNPNKEKKGNEILKRFKYLINKAKSGSKEHIAVLAGIAVVLVLVLSLSVWGISSLIGGDGAQVDSGADVSTEVDPEADNKYNKDDMALDTDKLKATILPKSDDAGEEYIKETLFIGDSNTVRTMMYGHTTWANVVAATSMGIQQVNTLPISEFEGLKDLVTVPTAVKIMQPKRVIITYGTNNTIGWSDKKFVETYEKAIKAITDAYPYCDIIVNAVPPIDKQRENLGITMQTIDGFNKALAEMCDKKGYKFLNSAEVLKDDKTGFAKTDYTISDGVHLSKSAMEALFNYIRTHAFITEDKRPKLSYIPKHIGVPIGIISSDPIAVRGGRVNVSFLSNDYELGTVEGEAEQGIKRSMGSSAVTAVPKTENGGVFTGWTCSYEGISSKEAENITYTVPKISDDITDIQIVANFKKVGVTINKTNLSLDKGSTGSLSASLSDSNFKGDKGITWSSNDPSIATVNSSGVVTGVSNGSTVIKASILNGKIEASCSVQVTATLQKISITAKDDKKEMATKSTLQLSIATTPTGAPISTAAWTTSDDTIATVNTAGLVTSKEKNGSVTITAKIGGLSAEYTINVKGPKPVTALSVKASAASITTGETSQLTVSYTPDDTTDGKAVTYSSNNTAIADVNGSGLVTGKSAGTVTITVKYTGVANSTITTSINITVTAKPTEIKPTGVVINEGNQAINVGGTVTFTATVTPENATNKTVTWNSSNTGVATVSAGGVVTGVSEGTITITATINGITSPEVTVTVSAAPPAVVTCADCKQQGHKDKTDQSCPNYVAPAPICMDCKQQGHTDKTDQSCPNYVAPAPTTTTTP